MHSAEVPFDYLVSKPPSCCKAYWDKATNMSFSLLPQTVSLEADSNVQDEGEDEEQQQQQQGQRTRKPRRRSAMLAKLKQQLKLN